MTTASTDAARRVSYQLETLWDFDYEPTHDELVHALRDGQEEPVEREHGDRLEPSRRQGGPGAEREMAFAGTNFFTRLTEEEQREIEIKVSCLAALAVPPRRAGRAGRLRPARQRDPRARRQALRLDPGRRRGPARRGVREVRQEAPQDLPGRSAAEGRCIDEILATNMWELKLLGMQMLDRGPRHRGLQPHAQADRRIRRSPASSTTCCRTRAGTSTSATSRCAARSPTWTPAKRELPRGLHASRPAT